MSLTFKVFWGIQYDSAGWGKVKKKIEKMRGQKVGGRWKRETKRGERMKRCGREMLEEKRTRD